MTYCNQCGGKNVAGSKFCSSCGKPILSNASILSVKPIKKRHLEDQNEELEEDSEELEIPEKLSYSIDMEHAKTTLRDVLWTREPKEPENRVVSDYKKVSKEELFKESTKACGPSRQAKEVDDSSA